MHHNSQSHNLFGRRNNDAIKKPILSQTQYPIDLTQETEYTTPVHGLNLEWFLKQMFKTASLRLLRNASLDKELNILISLRKKID